MSEAIQHTDLDIPIEDLDKLDEMDKKKKKLLILLLLVGLVAGATIFLFFFNRGAPTGFVAGDYLPEGRNATGRMAEVAQELADASYMTIQINMFPEFPYEGSVGDIGIINPAINVFPIAVDIELDATGQIIYSSGAVFPNEQILADRLDVPLSPGVHAATAVFSAYDPETHQRVWTGLFALEITVDG